MSDPNERSEHGWPVTVYRKNEKGWEMLLTRNSRGQRKAVKARPCRDCIELHSIRLRIRLVKQRRNDDQDGSKAVDDSTSKIHSNQNKTVVARRLDCIRITSHDRAPVIVLKFPDRKSCLEFSDQLMNLNPVPERSLLMGSSTTIADPSNFDTNDLRQDVTVNREPSGHANERQIRSFIGRLLHDEDFMNMCDILEANIAASVDGSMMFHALTNPRTVTPTQDDNDESPGEGTIHDTNDDTQHELTTDAKDDEIGTQHCNPLGSQKANDGDTECND